MKCQNLDTYIDELAHLTLVHKQELLGVIWSFFRFLHPTLWKVFPAVTFTFQFLRRVSKMFRHRCHPSKGPCPIRRFISQISSDDIRSSSPSIRHPNLQVSWTKIRKKLNIHTYVFPRKYFLSVDRFNRFNIKKKLFLFHLPQKSKMYFKMFKWLYVNQQKRNHWYFLFHIFFFLKKLRENCQWKGG
jgi:hypothetical protein